MTGCFISDKSDERSPLQRQLRATAVIVGGCGAIGVARPSVATTGIGRTRLTPKLTGLRVVEALGLMGLRRFARGVVRVRSTQRDDGLGAPKTAAGSRGLARPWANRTCSYISSRRTR